MHGNIKQSIRNRKFSKEVADHISEARRASTRKVYDAKWEVFTSWANHRKINPIKVSPNVIADFLIYLLRDKNCRVSTIKGNRSMISNTLKFRSKMNIGKPPIISELTNSFQMQRPVNRSLAPKWDLAFVLTYLCKDPFELMNKSSLFHLSIKTSFLFTMPDVSVKFLPLLVMRNFQIYKGVPINNQLIPLPMDRDGHDFHALFQYMFYTWVQNCTRIESFFNKILNVRHG